jgi:hypothetical protein
MDQVREPGKISRVNPGNFPGALGENWHGKLGRQSPAGLSEDVFSNSAMPVLEFENTP